MSYIFRRILFLANVILLLGSGALCAYSIFILFTNPEEWLFSLMMLGIGVITGVFFFVLYIVRKRKFPIPGIDYK
ncbi:MAG: hypothetical protein ABIJ04_12645 [Bacteroidota bacterium]